MDHQASSQIQHDNAPEREQAVQQAASLQDEAQAADFLLHCPWPEARLKAAELLHSRPLLEHVLAAVRNSDRRVEKLLQQRLDLMAQRETAGMRAREAVTHAEALAAATTLLVNQVADLDREWGQVGEAPQELLDRFRELREQLSIRLDQQTRLQKQVRELNTRLQQLAADAQPGGRMPTPTEVAGVLDQLEGEMAALCAEREAPSLPKRVLAEFREKHQALHAALDTLEARYAAVSAHEALLTEWEKQADRPGAKQAGKRSDKPDEKPDEKQAEVQTQEPAGTQAEIQMQEPAGKSAEEQADKQTESPSGKPTEKPAEKPARQQSLRDEAALRAAWDALPPLAEGDAPILTQRYQALLARLAGHKQAKVEGENEKRRQARQAFAAAMEAMEAALKAGNLHEAAEAEHKLREMDLSAAHLRGDQKVRLQNARGELGRLQGWAKWGGQMSREELLKTAQDLPARALQVAELAREVPALREKWKALDATAGPASKELWQRFDAACTTAYAPAAEHFKKLSQERHENLDRARALVDEVKAEGDKLEQQGEDQADWKALAGFCDRVQQQWRRLGPIDRKPRKALDTDFAAALARITGPLAARQSAEKEERVRLIEAASALDPAQRRAPEQLQELQQRWQQRARHLPLARHDEHALWQRFRAACDELFAKRKQHVKAADSERHQHLEAREAICKRLEAAVAEKPETIRTLMREAKTEWGRAGSVPRASEKQIEQRFTRALQALQKRLDEGEKSARQQRADILFQRFALCLRMEAALLAGAPVDAAAVREEWQAWPAPHSEVERALGQRYELDLRALEQGNPARRAEIESKQALLLHELLRAEIVLGMDSPAAYARERLKVQVEVLQSSLKSGEKPASPQALLLRLAQLPASLDEEGQGRLRRVLGRLA